MNWLGSSSGWITPSTVTGSGLAGATTAAGAGFAASLPRPNQPPPLPDPAATVAEAALSFSALAAASRASRSWMVLAAWACASAFHSAGTQPRFTSTTPFLQVKDREQEQKR